MSAGTQTFGRGRWVLIPVKIALITALLALVSFALSLFLAIMCLAIWAWVQGATPNMTVAYRYVALPVAVFVAGVALVSVSVMEVRQYRQDEPSDLS